jgi:hypothetical protein
VAHHDGLDDSRGSDGDGELGELGLVEVGAGLEGVAVDEFDSDFERLPGGFGCRFRCGGDVDGGGARGEEGFEAFA